VNKDVYILHTVEGCQKGQETIDAGYL